MARTQGWRNWTGRWWLASWLLMSGTIAFSGDALAQIAPDNTLGAENSIVTPNVEIKGIESDRIDGGARRGANLFHSFQNFNAGEGRGAYFNAPTGIENILSRVTGGNTSNILGTLGVLGNANLFLINPNGIIFGENARLDVGGSFVASTANSLLFGNNFEYNAANPQTPPLLEVNVPLGLQIGSSPGSIVNRSERLTVQPGKTLALVGGNISLAGGRIISQNAPIYLGGLAEAGTIAISPDGSLAFPEGLEKANISLSDGAAIGINVSGENSTPGNLIIEAGNLNLSQSYIGTLVDEKIEPTVETGNINIDVGNLRLLKGSGIVTAINRRLETSETQAGDIEINASNTVLLDGISTISSGNLPIDAVGQAGNIDIATGNLFLSDRSVIGTIGKTGNINIATGNLSLTNQSFISTLGNAGNINIATKNLSLNDSTISVSSSSVEQGNAGSIKITASDTMRLEGTSNWDDLLTAGASNIDNISLFSNLDSLSSTTNTADFGLSGIVNVGSRDILISTGSLDINNGSIASFALDGDSGNIQIDVTDSISLRGLIASVALNGNSGNIQIDATDSIFLSNATLGTLNLLGQGKTGDITLKAGDTISFEGEKGTSSSAISVGGSLPSLFSGDYEVEGGEITIEARSLFLTNSFLTSGTIGRGDAGDISIKVSDSISLDNSFISSSAGLPLSEGNAGKIDLQTQILTLTNGAEISSLTLGRGNAGKIQVNASDSIDISGVSKETIFDSSILNLLGISSSNIFGYETNLPGYSSGLITSTERGASGRGGEISVTTDALRISDGGVLSARTRNAADGGNIFVKVNTLEATGGGQILTNAFDSGRAGKMVIDAKDRITLAGSDRNFSSRLNQFGLEIVDPDSYASGLFARTQGTGLAGDITVTTSELQVLDEAQIAASSVGTESGDAGTLKVTADSISLENQGKIIAETEAGRGGNITLSVRDLLLLRNKSQISTTAGTERAGGDGGNIEFDAQFLAASENSDITANAFEGNGGNININAFGIFGLTESDSLTSASEIAASSELGLEGTIEIDTSQVDPNSGLVELPNVPVDTEVVRACAPSDSEEQSEFVVTGRGGLPASPDDALSSDAIEVDWVSLNPDLEAKSSPIENSVPAPAPIVEAKGWVMDDNGEILLIAPATVEQLQHNSQPLPKCQAS